MAVLIPFSGEENVILGVKGDSESTYRTGNVNITKGNIGLGDVGNFKAVSTVVSQGLSSTEQSNARSNIGAGTSSLTIGTTSTTALAGDTKYAGASTAGGAATSAAKLTNTSKIGDTNKPVYFTANGVPTAISYTIEKSVPSNAVFTDTTYSLVGANGTTGLIKNGSTVTSSSGYTACPIISGIPYYKDTNTTTGTSYNAGSCPDNTTFATNGSVARAYSALNSNLTPKILTITNSTEWTNNYTVAYKIDKLIIVLIYIVGTPVLNKEIATGLPIPNGRATCLIGSPSSGVQVDSAGKLYLNTLGTTSAGYFGGTLIYQCI